MAGVSNRGEGRPDEGVVRAVRAGAPAIDAGSLRPLGAGDFCVAYVTDDGWVVRVPRHEQATAALEREARLMEALAGRLPLPVPRPRFHEAAGRDRDAVAFAVHQRLDGVELGRSFWAGLPDGPRADLPARLGAFLAALHEVDPAVGTRAGLREVDHAAWMRTWARRAGADSGLPLPGDLLADLHACLAGWVAEDADLRYPAAILHADVSPGHVLVDPERGVITGIIDWGDAVIGDPARDLIFLYEDWGMDFLDLALGAYAPDAAGVDRLRSRVLLHYLADQLDWTVRAAEEGRTADARHGVEALAHGVRDIRTSRG